MASVTGSVIRVDERELRGHLDEVVRTSVKETLNACWTPRRTDYAKQSGTNALLSVWTRGPARTSGSYRPRRAR